MSYKFLRVENEPVTLKNGSQTSFAVITLDSPPLNALSSAVFHEIKAALEQLTRQETRVIVFTGAGKAFAAGADIAEMQSMNEASAEEYSALGNEVFSMIDEGPFAAIAMVNGFALGGGLELAMACDFRILSEAAVVGLPELTLGLIPGFGGTQRLSRIAGPGVARWLTFSGERLNAAEALRTGIAQKITPADELRKTVTGIASAIMQTGPRALKAVKQVMHEGSHLPVYEAVQIESRIFGSLFAYNEPKEGLSAFLEKRAPNF